MYLKDYEKVPLDKFRGLYSRGLKDQAPPDHARDLLNNLFADGQVQSRPGLVASITLGHSLCKRIFLATFDDTTFKILTCDESGNIYKDSDAGPLVTIAGSNDFAAINMFNKVFIAGVNDSVGADYLRIWDGTNPVRLAAGFAPAPGSAMIAADGAAGIVDVGTHKFAVSYETTTGFITPPGPKVAGVFTPTVYVAPGSKKVDLSNIPIGPAGTAKRRILVTKANEAEYFFLATINNNTDTTLTVDFVDTDLTVSADYLFDLLERIPAGCGLQKYHNRLVSYGGEGNTVRISRQADPESFSSVTGFVSIPAERDGNTVKSCWLLRDVLYFGTFPGIWATEDTKDEPSGDKFPWNVIDIDGGIGAFNSGVATITASQTARTADDMCLLGSKQGLIFFDGVSRKPELTWKIQDVWDRITFAKWHRILVTQDIWSRRVYVAVPLDGATDPTHILMGDYVEGWTADNMKWSLWQLPIAIKSMVMALFLSDNKYLLRIGSTDNKIHSIDPTAIDDEGAAINSYYDNGLIAGNQGNLCVYTALRFRVVGSGTFTLTLRGEDDSASQSPPSLTLSASPGKELLRLINFTGEKIGLKFGTNAVGQKYTLDRIDIFNKQWAEARPA